jgi:hypothetical protein
MPVKMTPAIFWAKVDKHGPTIYPELGPCWLWTGQLDKWGYGKLKLEGRSLLAHRYAFYLEHGRYPKPCGLHKCDNPACVRFTHLFEGTNAENCADRKLKGRAMRARLNEEQIHNILKRSSQGRSQISMAKEFGVTQTAVYRLVKRKRGAQ